MAEVAVVEIVAFAIAEAADEPSAYIDFSPGEMFGSGLIAGVIVLPGWMTGVLVGTAVRAVITHRVERRPIH